MTNNETEVVAAGNEQQTEQTVQTPTEVTRNQTWETNHKLITGAISYYLKMHERVPSKTELTEKTGLSWLTVHKHLKEYAAHPAIEEQKEQFNILTSNVLASMYKYAMGGDVKAAKLYFAAIDKLNHYPDEFGL